LSSFLGAQKQAHLLALLTSLLHCRLRINADQKLNPSSATKKPRQRIDTYVCVCKHTHTYIYIDIHASKSCPLYPNKTVPLHINWRLGGTNRELPLMGRDQATKPQWDKHLQICA